MWDGSTLVLSDYIQFSLNLNNQTNKNNKQLWHGNSGLFRPIGLSSNQKEQLSSHLVEVSAMNFASFTTHLIVSKGCTNIT